MNTLEQMESNVNIDEIGSNDVVFKAVMLTRPSCLKAIMETLLNRKIKELKILNSELPKVQFLEKGKRLDIYLESSDEYIDVEVSTSYNETTKKRNLSYICHIYSNSIKQGKNYTNYKKSSIYNLIWGKKGKYLHTTGRITDEYGNIISDMLNYNTIHMDNYMERYYNNDIEFILENKYLIMLGLKLEELDQLIELTKGDEIVKEYKEGLESVLNDYEIAPYIEGERDREMLLQGTIEEAEAIKKEARKALKKTEKKLENTEKKLENAESKLEKMKKEIVKINEEYENSKEEAKKQGIEQGTEKNERETIQKLLSKGFTVIQISEMLDLDKDKIQNFL